MNFQSPPPSGIHFEVLDHAGIITLDRPKALNALTATMVRALSAQLLAWSNDPAIALVIIKSAGGRAFCAGGDVGQVIEMIDELGIDEAHRFFHDEYRLNWRIKNYPKPYIAMIDGIVMGGGVGISAHGQYRIIGPDTMFAMPETAIGLFPDVGGTYVLSRMAGGLGHYLGLSGARMRGAQVVKAGIGTHHVASNDHGALIKDLSSRRPTAAIDGGVAGLLNDAQITTGEDPVFDEIDAIDRLYAPAEFSEIDQRLIEDGSEFAAKQRQILARMSPLSLAVTASQLVRGRDLDFEGCMRLEYQMVRRFLDQSDFREGVRAMIVDKDRNPNWRYRGDDPSSLKRYFEDHVPSLNFDWKEDAHAG